MKLGELDNLIGLAQSGRYDDMNAALHRIMDGDKAALDAADRLAEAAQEMADAPFANLLTPRTREALAAYRKARSTAP